MRLQAGHQFVTQVFQRILTLYAVRLHLVLVDIAVGHIQFLQHALCRHQFLQVQCHTGLYARGIHLREVDRLPRRLGVIAAPDPVYQVLAVVAIHTHRSLQGIRVVFQSALPGSQFLGFQVLVGLVSTHRVVEFRDRGHAQRGVV